VPNAYTEARDCTQLCCWDKSVPPPRNPTLTGAYSITRGRNKTEMSVGCKTRTFRLRFSKSAYAARAAEAGWQPESFL